MLAIGRVVRAVPGTQRPLGVGHYGQVAPIGRTDSRRVVIASVFLFTAKYYHFHLLQFFRHLRFGNRKNSITFRGLLPADISLTIPHLEYKKLFKYLFMAYNRPLLSIFRSLLLITLLSAPIISHAVRAYPYPVTVSQPDGNKVTVQIHGDEFFNYTTTRDGYVVVRKSDGYYYYGDYSTGQLNVTSRVGSPGAVRASKGVPPAYAMREAQQNREKFMRAQNNISPLTRASKPLPTKALVILVGYSDLPFENSKSSFNNMMNQAGYAENGGTGSVKDYFRDNSKGKFNPDFDVVGPIALSGTMEYYGRKITGNQVGQNVQKMVVEACQKAYDQGVNFSQYDCDNDGYVDNVFIYFAGHNPAEGGPDDNVWPHQSSVAGVSGTEFNGVRIGSYACASEYKGASGTNMAGIGNFCHEFGHVLGLPDFYDTDGKYDAPGFYLSLALMDGGNYNNNGRTPPAFTGPERYLMGWQDNLVYLDGNQSLTVKPVANNEIYMLRTNNDGEFFMLDNRQQTGWDKYISREGDADAHGLVIYHLDSSANMVGGTSARSLWALNKINTVAAHECAQIVTPRGNIDRSQISKLFFPGPSPAKTSHDFVGWEGLPTGVEITDIVEGAGNITLNVASDQNTISLQGSVVNTSQQPLRDVVMTMTKVSSFSGAQKQLSPDGLFSIWSLTPDTRAGFSKQTTTSPDGKYNFTGSDITTGNYTVTAENYGYPTANLAKKLVVGGNKLDFVLSSYEDLSSANLKWYQNNTPQYGFTMNSMVPVMGAAMWDNSDLAPYADYELKEVSIFMVQNCDFTVKIYFDNVLAHSKRAKTTSNNGFTVVDLSTDNITVPTGKSMKIAFEFKNYLLDQMLFCMDKAPVVSGKGNLASTDGGQSWQQRDNNGVGNLMIGALIQDATPPEGAVSVRVTPGQQYADLKLFGPLKTSSKWFIRWKNLTTKELSPVTEVTNPEYSIAGLTPNTEYEITAAESAADLGTAGKHFIKKFTTASLTEIYPAIDGLRYNYERGTNLKLRLKNLRTPITSQIWKIDGQTVEGVETTLNVAGEHTVSVELTYSGGGSETISRIIKVQ